MTEEAFFELAKRHDLTFEYSDDHSVWQRGCDSLAKVREAAKSLPPDVAARIWNSVVDTKMREGYRDQFYWKVPASAAP